MLATAMVVRQKGGPFEECQIEVDDPRPDEVLVRIVATGMCQSDLHIMNQRHPYPLPAVLGHEGAGIVEKVGSGISDLRQGDHVVLTFNSCGTCRNCCTGHQAYCLSLPALNFSGRRPDGSCTLKCNGADLHGSFFSQSSFASHVLANRRNVVTVGKTLPLQYLGPLGCGIQTGAGTVFNVLAPPKGATVAVFGAGAVGLSAIMAAKLMECSRIIAVDLVAERLQLARDLGATEVINSSDAVSFSRLVGAADLDYAIDTTGVLHVIEAAISSLAIHGTCALIGSISKGATIKLELQHMSRRTLTGVLEGDATPEILIPKLAHLFQQGKFPLDRLIRFYEFRDINQAVKDSVSGVTVKPILRFDNPSNH